ncbi:20347_t:CDS:1, partial [Dentiscutata erythropus]
VKTKSTSTKKPSFKKTPTIKIVDVKFPPTLNVEYFVQKKKQRVLKFPNAFVFFRSVYSQTLRDEGIKLSQSDVSASASFVWHNNLSTEVKDFYFNFASNVRNQYLRKHPVTYYKCEWKSESKSMVTSKDEPKKLKTFNFIYEHQNPKIVKPTSLQEIPQPTKVIPSQMNNVINQPINMTSWSNNIFRGQPSLFNNGNQALLAAGSNLFCDLQLDTINFDHLFSSGGSDDNEREIFNLCTCTNFNDINNFILSTHE